MEELKLYINKMHTAVIAEFLLSFLFVVLLIKLIGWVCYKIEHSSSEANKSFLIKVVEAIERPIKVVVLIIWLSICIRIVTSNIDKSFESNIHPIHSAIITITLTWFVLRSLYLYEKHSLQDINVEYKGSVDLLLKVLKILTFVVSFTILLDVFGFNITGILTIGGIGGAAIAFASQDMIKNFFGTITLYMDKPFHVGDVIKIDSINVIGEVQEIGWRITKILSGEKIPIYVQNSTFSDKSIENLSRISNKKISDKIGIWCCDSSKLKSLISEITEYFNNHEDVDKNSTIGINVSELGNGYTEFTINAFILATSGSELNVKKSDIILDVMDIINKNELSVAYMNESKSMISMWEKYPKES